jgi:aspartyl-tRNA(Asn)/glutamyl-tRNA(Gln) amidotransferase subunit B
MEIHVQLATASKMFTGAANGFGGEPNSQVDPVILGLPGVLPVMNKTAVEYSIKAGLALGCKIAKHTKWDRKSYYYPDLPKNYQISQYDMPLCYEGEFDLALKSGEVRKVRIRRAHLEEDAGKLLHDAPGGYHIDWSIVDLNRAGTPLLEIVTEPDLSNGEEVAAFGQELQKLVQFLGVSHAQMQMGHMRFEPNINVHITDGEGKIHKTAITEIKNLNSFSVLQRATDYEAQRQINQWIDTGDFGRKSTYGWDESTGTTFHQRNKEDANDYRYFPDPDLVPVEVSDEWLTELKTQIGELPAARRKRYVDQLGLNTADAATLAGDRKLGDFYEKTLNSKAKPTRTANLILSHGFRLSNIKSKPVYDLGLTPAVFEEVAAMIDGDVISSSAATAIFDRLAETGGSSAAAVADELGLRQVSDTGPIDAAIDAMLADPKAAKSLADFRGGKASAMGALMGMVMKSGKGFNPKLVQERLKAKLG